MIVRLNKKLLLTAVETLARHDERLNHVVTNYGPPPLWRRSEGFETLIYIILEQQVSLASAKAVYDKLLNGLPSCTPDNFMALSDVVLKSMGFSRQKASYGRNLAEAILTGDLDLAAMSGLKDDQARQQLMNVKGIGPWTADIYLLRALDRPDIWPDGDLALTLAAQQLYKLGSRPSTDRLRALSNTWKPWRAAAARILWHYYLNK